jgi:hypothetical protein
VSSRPGYGSIASSYEHGNSDAVKDGGFLEELNVHSGRTLSHGSSLHVSNNELLKQSSFVLHGYYIKLTTGLPITFKVCHWVNDASATDEVNNH